MRRLMTLAMGCVALAVTAGVAGAIASDTPAADEGTDQPKAEPEKMAAAETDEEFVPPPGYRRMKRGKHVVYCRKETEIGSRFPVLHCYSQEQFKEIAMAQERGNREFEQRRRICTTQTACD